jgi:hypothetical protein
LHGTLTSFGIDGRAALGGAQSLRENLFSPEALRSTKNPSERRPSAAALWIVVDSGAER